MLSTYDVKSLQKPRGLEKTSDIFIIAAEKDGEMANKIYNGLQRKGFNVWNKTESFVIGEEEEIAQGIERAGVIAYLISNDVWGSDVCQKELTVALADDKHIIPLLVAPSPLKGIVSSVFTVPLIDFTDPKKYDISLEQLSQQIRKLGVRSRSEIAAIRVPAPRRQIASWQSVLAALFIAAMGFTGGMLYLTPRVQKADTLYQEATAAAAVARQNEQQAIVQAQKATTAAATARQNEQQAKAQAQKATAAAAVARQNEQQAKTQAQKSDAIAIVARKNERDAKTNLSIVLGRERNALKALKDAKINLSIVIKREKEAIGREKKALQQAGQADLRAFSAEQRVDTLTNLLRTYESRNPSPEGNPPLNP